MRRLNQRPRPNWRAQCESVGFNFHSIDGVYWDETAAYQFSLEQVETLESVIEDLHERYLNAVEWVVSNGHFEPFALSPMAIEEITKSWRRRDPSIYGRFDFYWNGVDAPKMLEYNADTPTGLLESSVVQWQWLNDVLPQADQFNSLHEKLIARWRRLDLSNLVHFCAIDAHEEDIGNTLYMMDVAQQAGLNTQFLAVEDIGYDVERKAFVDAQARTIQHCFKLYPWEWLWQDDFGVHIAENPLRFYEPAWKILMSSKAMLPILWQLNKSHPNILSASFNDDLAGAYVRKPLYSREGENIAIVNGLDSIATGGPHEGARCIYQSYAPLPKFSDSYTVVGGWVVGDEAAGMGIREDASLITRDTSRFVPHYFYE